MFMMVLMFGVLLGMLTAFIAANLLPHRGSILPVNLLAGLFGAWAGGFALYWLGVNLGNSVANGVLVTIVEVVGAVVFFFGAGLLPIHEEQPGES